MSPLKITTLKLDPSAHWLANNLRGYSGQFLHEFISEAIMEKADKMLKEGLIDEIPRIPDFVKKNS